MSREDGEFGNTLYVLFHGAWAFVENHFEPDCIHAYAANVDRHSYLAGSWLAERKILPGSTLELHGVEKHPKKPASIRDCDKGFVLFECRHACPVGAYAEVRMRRPRQIYPEMIVPDVSVSSTDGKVLSHNMGLVPVFEFGLEDDPFLEQHSPSLRFWSEKRSEVHPVTLHLYAADDTPVPPGSSQISGDFGRVAALLGFDASVRNPQPVPVGNDKVVTPGLKGKREFEVKTFLHNRRKILRDLGRQMQHEGEDANLRWNHPPIAAADLSSCGGGGGGS